MKKKLTVTVATIAVLLTVVALFFTACQKDNSSIVPSASTTESLAQRVAPSVPAILQVPAGNVVGFQTFAEGVQIYVCRETSPGVFEWVFRAPEATLYSNAALNGVVGIHYAGPAWESNSGSKVVGTRLQGTTVDQSAIPWLLLGAVSSHGPGVFEGVTYIQRVKTVGGKAPASGASASTVGQEARIPYTAEYFFFKPE